MIFILSLLEKWAIFSSWLYIPLLAKRLGANLFQVGMVLFSFGVGGFFSYYLFGRLTDITGRKREFLIGGFLFSSLIYYLHAYVSSLVHLFLLRFLAGIALGIYSFSLVVLASQHGNLGRKIGIINLLSAVGILIGWLWAGLLQKFRWIFFSSSLLFLLNTFLSLFLREKAVSPFKLPLFPLKVIRQNWRIYVSFLLRHTGATAIWSFFPIYLKKLGAGERMISLIYSLNPLTQVMTLSLLLLLLNKLSPSRLFDRGLLLSSLAFLLYSLIPSYIWAFPITSLVGLSWAIMFTGALVHLTLFNPEKGTSTGLLGSSWSLAFITGPLLGGTFSYLLGMRIAIFLAGLLSLGGWWLAKKG